MGAVIQPNPDATRTRRIVLVLAGAVLTLALAVVALVAGLVVWGGSMFNEQAQAAMQEQPEIVEHIGSISSISLDYEATGAAIGMDVFVFDVVGDKGRGKVTAEFITVDENSEVLGEGELRLEDGRTIEFSGAHATHAVE